MFDVKIEEKFLENNTVCVFGVIDDEMSKKVCKQLLFLQFKFKEECSINSKVVVLINSPGGSVTAGLAIHDCLTSLGCDIITICLGQASSMGALLLSAGTKRYALTNSEIMIHQVLGGAQGQASDIVIHCEHIVKTKKRLNQILAKNTKKTEEQIKLDTERDYYMSPLEAKEYGIIDNILNSFYEVYYEISN